MIDPIGLETVRYPGRPARPVAKRLYIHRSTNISVDQLEICSTFCEDLIEIKCVAVYLLANQAGNPNASKEDFRKILDSTAGRRTGGQAADAIQGGWRGRT